MSQTAALYQLQTLDSEIDAIRKRLSEITALLSQNEAVQDAQAALARVEEEYKHWHQRQTDLELERSKLKDETQATEQRLYSGKVKNPRELTDLQDKTAELKRRRESLEEPLLEAMYGVEESGEAVVVAKSVLERVMNEQADTIEALTDEQTALTTRLSDMESKVRQIRANILPIHLSHYDTLRKRPGGIAVTQVKSDECGVCGVQLTSQMAQQVRRGEVLSCPTCDRILHAG